MSKDSFETVVNELKALSTEEQRQVRDLLDSWLTVPALPPSEQALTQSLLSAGLLKQIPSPIIELTHYNERTPVTVQGQPVSETLLEDRE